MLDVFSHPYQLDESISNFRVVGWYFSFLFKKTSVENLIWRLIWVCTVCRRMLGLGHEVTVIETVCHFIKFIKQVGEKG